MFREKSFNSLNLTKRKKSRCSYLNRNGYHKKKCWESFHLDSKRLETTQLSIDTGPKTANSQYQLIYPTSEGYNLKNISGYTCLIYTTDKDINFMFWNKQTNKQILKTSKRSSTSDFAHSPNLNYFIQPKMGAFPAIRWQTERPKNTTRNKCGKTNETRFAGRFRTQESQYYRPHI